MAINKVVYGADTLVDLTDDTVTAEDVLNNKSFHTPDGAKRTGTASYPVTDVQVNGESVMDGTVAKIEQPTSEVKTATDTFTTINGGLLSSLKVALSPNQDLHGYDEPWVGGAGKNKLPLVLADIKSANTSGTWSGNVYSVSGGTIEVLVDDANNVIGIKPNGTFSATVIFYLVNNYTFKAGSYALNGCPTGGDSSTYELRIGNIIAQDYGSGATYTLGSDTMSMASIIIRSGQDMSGKNFYPMIRLASESDPTFAPYSNICPISGHTQVKINNGKNLIGLGTRLDGYAGTTYFETTLVAVGYYFATSDLPDVVTISDVGGNRAYISYYNEVPAYGVVYLSKDQSQQTVPKTFTVDKTAEYVHIQLSYGTTDVTNIQIEEGSTATPYVPYNGYQVTVNLGGTYYSGTLDVVTGVFTPNTVEKDMGNITYNYNSAENIFGTELISDMADPIPTKVQLMCSALNALTPKDIAGIKNADDNSIAFNSASGAKFMRIKCTSYTDGNALKTAMTGQKIVYEIINPTPIQLTPQQVKALVGENHLSAPLEGQEITESKYKQAFTFDDVITYIQSLS